MKRGITLIETVFLFALTTLMLWALVTLYLTFTAALGYERSVLATDGSAGATMSALQLAVLPAKNVVASHSFAGTLYSSSGSVLVLELPGIDASGNALTGVSDYVAFYTSGTTIYRRVETGAGSVRPSGQTILSTVLQSLSFTYDDADFSKVTNVTVDLTTSSTYRNKTSQAHLKEQLYLRNH